MDELVIETPRQLRFAMTVLPPIGKHKRYPALTLTVIHASSGEHRMGASHPMETDHRSPCGLLERRSRSWTGMRSAGRSKSFTRC